VFTCIFTAGIIVSAVIILTMWKNTHYRYNYIAVFLMFRNNRIGMSKLYRADGVFMVNSVNTSYYFILYTYFPVVDTGATTARTHTHTRQTYFSK